MFGNCASRSGGNWSALAILGTHLRVVVEPPLLPAIVAAVDSGNLISLASLYFLPLMTTFIFLPDPSKDVSLYFRPLQIASVI